MHWRDVRAQRSYSGFVYGMRYPSILQILSIPTIPVAARNAASARLLASVNASDGGGAVDFAPRATDESSAAATLAWYLDLADRLNAVSGLPVLDRAKCLSFRDGVAHCVIPTLLGGLRPMEALLRIARGLAENPHGETGEQIARQFEELSQAKEPNSNWPRYFRAAIDGGVVVQQLPGGLTQFGLGKYSARMGFAFGEETSAMAARIARDKAMTSLLLARFRLPVAEHVFVNDAAEAIAAAERFGYPVVVKPRDLDGGVGVRADLRTADEVTEAFAVGEKSGRRLMVQKHYDGRDYRLYVYQGRLIWANERRPGSVTGDGVQTIAQLVAALNAEPGRGDGKHNRLRTIALDEEALGLIAREGWTLDSVLAKGEICRLRRIANISTGGRPVAVFDAVHPDNAKLAERVAEVVGLDLAGIDLIIPDIAVSWKEGGAIVCEVNAGPEIGGNTSLHLYPYLLREMLKGDGNIPVVAVFGESLAHRITEEMGRIGVTAGLHTAAGLAIGAEWIDQGDISCLDAGRILSADRRVEAMILAHCDRSMIESGLPTPKIDLLIVSADEKPDPAVLGFLKPACKASMSVGPIDQEELRELVGKIIGG